MKRKIIAMIPARVGSQRLKFKNLALLNGKPLIYYSIQAAKKSKIFNQIVLNSDHKIFKKISQRYKISFYLRPKKIGKSNTKSDEVVNDFIKKYNDNDILVWVNPIAPLQDSEDINNIVRFFIKKKLDSLITTEKKQVHCLYKKKPINFKIREKFAKTQNLEPIDFFSYTIMMWKTKTFTKNYRKYKSGIICGKFSSYNLDSSKSTIIKDSNDLKLVESLMKSSKNKYKKVKYDKIYKNLLKNK